jgi:hypothetical protein
MKIRATTPQKITISGYGTVFPLLAKAQVPIAQTTQTMTQMIASLNSNPIAPLGKILNANVSNVIIS